MDIKHDGSYYDLPPDCHTLTDVIHKCDMGYARGNIFKAAYRWEKKGVSDDSTENIIYNLEKIAWYTDFILRQLYAEMEGNPRRVSEVQENKGIWFRD